jgi:hypothetical protein
VDIGSLLATGGSQTVRWPTESNVTCTRKFPSKGIFLKRTNRSSFFRIASPLDRAAFLTSFAERSRTGTRSSSIWQSAPAVGESLYPSRRPGNPFAEADCVADCDRAAHCALTLRRLQEDDRVPFPCLSRASIAPLQRRAGVTFRESGLWPFQHGFRLSAYSLAIPHLSTM